MSQCDVCLGSGKQKAYRMKDGSIPMFTTSVEANKWFYDAEERGEFLLIDVSCRICNGSGVLPVYPEPSYWKGREDEADKQFDQSFFGLGKFIRKVLDE